MTQAAWLLGRGITPLQPGLGAGPLAFERCTPVGWLFSADFVNRATCFLIEENWIATAAHVLPNARVAAAHVVAFNYARGGDPRDRDAYALCPDDRGYFGINRDAQGLDVALVRVCHRPARAGPGVAWGTVAIAAPQEALPASEIVLVQHPNVHDVKCYSTGKIETPKEGFVGHGAASDYGTSGAPLLDTDGHWLGIHKGSSSGIQRATSAVAVFDWLRSQFAKLPPELQGIL